MAPRKARRARDELHQVDMYVGTRLRLRRTLLGMSQDQLGHAVGLTFQQVQKYERGDNRISASRLYDFSRVLSVPVAYFFDGMDAVPAEQHPGSEEASKPSAATEGLDPMMRRETLELVRAYYRIRDPDTRHKVRDLMVTMAPEPSRDKQS